STTRCCRRSTTRTTIGASSAATPAITVIRTRTGRRLSRIGRRVDPRRPISTSDPPLAVALPAHERRNGNERVQSLCAGDPVWFESGDASLAPVPEAFLGPFLLPALDRHSSLASDAELDPV